MYRDARGENEVIAAVLQDKGRIDLDQLESEMSKNTSLVSIMAVNNEIGVVQPIKEIGELCRKNKVLFCYLILWQNVS